MIPFFVGYALLVWIPAARYRRHWISMVVVLTGLLGLLGISAAHYELRHLSPSWYIQGMQVLLYPYTALVTAIGLFIALLPRRFDGGCPRCGYPVDGLPEPVDRCPECGCRATPVAPAPRHRPSGAARTDLSLSDFELAAREAPRDTAEQDHDRQPADQRPAERAPAPR